MSINDYGQAIYKALDDIRRILSKQSLIRLYLMTPVVNTLSTTGEGVLNGASSDIVGSARYCQSACIRVQNMSTAAYVGIGTIRGQLSRLTAVGDCYTITVPDGFYFDLAEIWAIADAGTPIIEISGLIYPPSTMPNGMTPKVSV
jgi:hypothetical protein